MQTNFKNYMNPTAVNSTVTWQENIEVQIFLIATYWEGPYTGQAIGNVPHGVGRLVDQQNNLYEGQFVNGMVDGYMRIINDDSYDIGKYSEGRSVCFEVIDAKTGEVITHKDC